MSVINLARKVLGPVIEFPRRWNRQDVRFSTTSDRLLLGRLASWHVRSMQTIGSLKDVEFKVTSQWGEDGIIDWLVERCEIPDRSTSFVEFGVQDYEEANTRFLLQNRNWRGLVMDGGTAMFQAIREAGLQISYDLNVKQAFITRENVNDLIAQGGITGEIGLLSIDVDGNDYWIWQAIDVVNPIIVVCEYNAVFGDIHAISVPYDPDFYRTSAHFSNLYFGGSIKAVQSLAERKGYKFVGTTSVGNDAFFVRQDYAGLVDASIGSVDPAFSRFRESRGQAEEFTHLRSGARLAAISHLPVVNTATGQTTKIAELGSVYSGAWESAMM